MLEPSLKAKFLAKLTHVQLSHFQDKTEAVYLAAITALPYISLSTLAHS